MRDIERVYKALADWNRLRILKILEVLSEALSNSIKLHSFKLSP